MLVNLLDKTILEINYFCTLSSHGLKLLLLKVKFVPFLSLAKQDVCQRKPDITTLAINVGK